MNDFWQEEEDGTVSGIAAVNGAEIRYFAPKESALWERILANTEAEEFRVFAQTPPDSPSLCVLAEADGLQLLEQGKGIASALNGLKVQISYGLDVDFTHPHDMACVLLSGNPFTYAQLELAERVSDTVVCVSGDRIDRMGSPKEIFFSDYIAKLYHMEPGKYDPCFDTLEYVPKV